MKQKEGDIIKFIRSKDYVYKKSIGSGGTGQTILIHDPITEFNFVCKKYLPVQIEYEDEFFDRFIDEIKIMYPLYHPNIVRIYNYYLYPEHKTGYILMEHINGTTIGDFLGFENHEVHEKIFIQLIEAFAYLEGKGVLHRDIRSNNIMVTNDGDVKIIDFGFGKKLEADDDNASIKLNWPVSEMPSEINRDIYNHKTEVYFVGKMFEYFIDDNFIEDFKYDHIITQMTRVDVKSRLNSFNEVLERIANLRIREEMFTDEEKETYVDFADELISVIVHFNEGWSQNDDPSIILDGLDDLLNSSQLEDYIQNNSQLLSCFINGGFKYKTKSTIETNIVHEFYKLLASCNEEKQEIILKNLSVRLSKIKIEYLDDDIPF